MSGSRGFAWVDELRRDITLALRMLRTHPAFTVVAVLTLGVGIGVNTIVFSVTNAVLFKGFPLVDANDRLVYMTSGPGCCVSYPDYEDWRSQATSFTGMALTHGIGVAFSDGTGGSEIYAATEITSNTFRLVGQRPALGRDFTSADEEPGAPPVAILRHAFWQRRFGGDADVIGRTVRLNGVPTTIVGVMPDGFSFPQNQDLWTPLVPTPDVRQRDNRNTWFVLGRLADGVSIELARAEMTTIGRRLGDAYPATNQGRNLIPYVSTFEDFFIGARAGAVYRTMWGAVAFVLLIACANLANLLLGRALGRAREIAVRMAIGAGRWRVIRQLLIESMTLSTLGGLVGWFIARWGIRLYAMTANGSGISEETFGVWFMDIIDYSMDYRVFLYLAAISVGTGILFGLVPALRLSTLDVNGALKDGGRGVSADARTRRASSLLVAAEVTLTVVLMAGAGVLLRTFLDVYRADAGIQSTNVMAAQVSLPQAAYATPAAQIDFFDRLTARLAGRGELESLGIATAIPGWDLAPRSVEIDGRPVVDPQQRPVAGQVTIGGEYFRSLGILVAGRDFRDTDDAEREPVAIVNERFVAEFLQGREAIGLRVRVYTRDAASSWMRVVGVTPNVSQSRDLQQRNSLVYVPYRQQPIGGMWVMARAKSAPEALGHAIARDVAAIDPDVPLMDGVLPLAERLARNYQYRGVMAALFTVFAGIALLLASLGLYGVMARAVSERTQEIGIRAAMGATTRDIMALVLQQAMSTVGLGLAGGVVLSIVLGRVLRAEFSQVSPSDPGMMAAAIVLLVCGAAIGCVLPVRRALRLDPVVALKPAD
jgi:putative ABC transport system permease protein